MKRAGHQGDHDPCRRPQALAREPAGTPGTSARAPPGFTFSGDPTARAGAARQQAAAPRAAAGHARVPVRTGPLVHAGVYAGVGAVVLSAYVQARSTTT
jgi:hypothetical protein